MAAVMKQARDYVEQVVASFKKKFGARKVTLDTSPLGTFKLNVTEDIALYLLSLVPSTSGNKGSAIAEFNVDAVGNRRPKNPNIDRLMAAIRDGRFDPDNGETIKIAVGRDGELMLIDGQNRINAILGCIQDKSDSIDSVTVTVMTGMDPSCIFTIDTGTGRTAADFLYICGLKGQHAYTGDVASAGRDVRRATLNSDGHPFRNPSKRNAFSEGDLARWLLGGDEDDKAMAYGFDGETVGETLRQIRHEHASELGDIANRLKDGNAGAKSWMTYLLWEWLQRDKELAESVISYLATNQDIDLPRANGKPATIWKYARNFARMAHEDSQGFKAANKTAHDLTILGYMIAWNHTRGRKTDSRVASAASFKNVVLSYYETDKFDDKGHAILARVPVWPGVE